MRFARSSSRDAMPLFAGQLPFDAGFEVVRGFPEELETAGADRRWLHRDATRFTDELDQISGVKAVDGHLHRLTGETEQPGEDRWISLFATMASRARYWAKLMPSDSSD